MIDMETTELTVNLSELLDASENVLVVADKAVRNVLDRVVRSYPTKGGVAVEGDEVVIKPWQLWCGREQYADECGCPEDDHD
jgi:hypothetical protein